MVMMTIFFLSVESGVNIDDDDDVNNEDDNDKFLLFLAGILTHLQNFTKYMKNWKPWNQLRHQQELRRFLTVLVLPLKISLGVQSKPSFYNFESPYQSISSRRFSHTSLFLCIILTFWKFPLFVNL